MTGAEPDPPAPPKLRDVADVSALFEQIRDEAYRAARQLGGPSHELPSDLAQSVAREIWQEADALEHRGPAALRGLVKKVLRAKIVEKLRRHMAARRSGARTVPLDGDTPSVGFEPQAEAPGPASQLAAEEGFAALRALLAGAGGVLTERERDVVERRLRGETHETIATALGISAGNSMRIHSDALAAMRRRVARG